MTKDNEHCPACSQQTHQLLSWDFSGLNNSIFNYTAKLNNCENCGLIYIKNIDDKTLSKFYDNECQYFNKEHFSINEKSNQAKYRHYIEILNNNEVISGDMVDIGCGRGGFIEALAKNNWNGLCHGVDIDTKSLQPNPNTNNKVTYYNGNIFSLPFKNQSIKLITSFHVLEHLNNLNSAIAEMERILCQGGHILIEVPDAELYREVPIGTAFWMSIREHVNHFSSTALQLALNNHGLNVKKIIRQRLPTPEFSYPSLMILAKKEKVSGNANKNKHVSISNFALESHKTLLNQADILRKKTNNGPLTFWGCSSNLFSLLPLLKDIESRICDTSILKQSAHYQGKKISKPESLPIEGTLVIAPYLYAQSIVKNAKEIGWPSRSICTLK